MKSNQIVKKALELQTIIPAFNIPHLPMVEPISAAIKDNNTVGMIQVARVEWLNFQSKSLEDIAKEYQKYEKPGYTLLHLDHIPVIDENDKHVDYMSLIKRACACGYQSVMIDGSRLSLEGNIQATKEVADYVHQQNIACEAELGAVMGHESEPINLTYEEIFEQRIGFTDIDETKKFVEESDCDWLSVAAGSIHGAVAESLRDQKKPEGKIDIDYLQKLFAVSQIPLVLHGGSGIPNSYIQAAIKAGIAKMNIGTELRQCYEFSLREDKDIAKAQEKVYEVCSKMIKEDLEIVNNYDLLNE